VQTCKFPDRKKQGGPWFSSNNGQISLPGFHPPIIFTASDSFLPAIIFRIFGKTATGKNKTYRTIYLLQLFHLCKFLLEFYHLIFRKLLDLPAFYFADNARPNFRLSPFFFIWFKPISFGGFYETVQDGASFCASRLLEKKKVPGKCQANLNFTPGVVQHNQEHPNSHEIKIKAHFALRPRTCMG
jgi:hypothetical protein